MKIATANPVTFKFYEFFSVKIRGTCRCTRYGRKKQGIGLRVCMGTMGGLGNSRIPKKKKGIPVFFPNTTGGMRNSMAPQRHTGGPLLNISVRKMADSLLCFHEGAKGPPNHRRPLSFCLLDQLGCLHAGAAADCCQPTKRLARMLKLRAEERVKR